MCKATSGRQPDRGNSFTDLASTWHDSPGTSEPQAWSSKRFEAAARLQLPIVAVEKAYISFLSALGQQRQAQ